jgi:hypothetical protein
LVPSCSIPTVWTRRKDEADPNREFIRDFHDNPITLSPLSPLCGRSKHEESSLFFVYGHCDTMPAPWHIAIT